MNNSGTKTLWETYVQSECADGNYNNISSPSYNQSALWDCWYSTICTLVSQCRSRNPSWV